MYIKRTHVFSKFQKNLMNGSNVMGQKVSFWPFLTHLTLRGSQTRIFPGSRILKSYVYQLSSCFCWVSEKSNKWNKNDGAKILIFGCFLPLWPLLTPWGRNPSFFQKSKNAVPLAHRINNFMQNFRKIQCAVFSPEGRTDGRTGVNS